MHVTSARIWLALGVAAVIALSLGSVRFFGRYQPLADLMGGPTGLDQIGLQVHDAQVTGRVSGLRRWRVSAALITFSRDQRQVVADGLKHGELDDSQEHAIARLMAGGVIYQSSVPVFGAGVQGNLQVTGGLRARLLRPYGPTLTAAGLSWNPTQNLVQSAGPVSALFPAHPGTAIGGAQLVADGVEWNAQSDLMQSPGRVRVTFAGHVGTAIGTGVLVDLHTGNLTLHSLTGTFNLARIVQNDMAKRSSHPLAVLTGVALLAAPLAAAPAKPVTYAAGQTLWLNAQHQAQMTKGVTIKQDDETLQTASAIVNFDDQQHALNAQSRTPVHLWDTQDDLTGQQGDIDFTTHIATVRDNVVLTVKPGPSNTDAPKSSLRSRFKSPATLTCQLMTYNYRTKFGTVPGPLTVHQKDRVLTADSGTYDGRLQIITLIGHVHGQNPDGEINASKAIIGVRSGEEFILSPQPTHGMWQVNNNSSSSDGGNDNSSDNGPVDDPNGYNAIMNSGEMPTPAPAAPTPGSPTPGEANPPSGSSSAASPPAPGPDSGTPGSPGSTGATPP